MNFSENWFHLDQILGKFNDSGITLPDVRNCLENKCHYHSQKLMPLETIL